MLAQFIYLVGFNGAWNRSVLLSQMVFLVTVRSQFFFNLLYEVIYFVPYDRLTYHVELKDRVYYEAFVYQFFTIEIVHIYVIEKIYVIKYRSYQIVKSEIIHQYTLSSRLFPMRSKPPTELFCSFSDGQILRISLVFVPLLFFHSLFLLQILIGLLLSFFDKYSGLQASFSFNLYRSISSFLILEWNHFIRTRSGPFFSFLLLFQTIFKIVNSP